MKINFGKFKSRKIIIGANEKMRPTQSMTKSIIFDTLKISKGTRVLDLFSGTGLLGFESMSLGADKVYWSDNNIESYKSIKNNIEKFKLDKDNFIVFKTDFRIMIKKLPFKANLIFLDPPFTATHYYDEALDLILKYEVLEKNGIIVIEKPYKSEIKSIEKFNILKHKKIGNKDIVFLTL